MSDEYYDNEEDICDEECDDEKCDEKCENKCDEKYDDECYDDKELNDEEESEGSYHNSSDENSNKKNETKKTKRKKRDSSPIIYSNVTLTGPKKIFENSKELELLIKNENTYSRENIFLTAKDLFRNKELIKLVQTILKTDSQKGIEKGIKKGTEKGTEKGIKKVSEKGSRKESKKPLKKEAEANKLKEIVRPCVIRGSIGSGKSELVKTISREMGYDLQEFDMEFDEFSMSSLQKALHKKENPIGIELMFNMNKKKAVLLKHYDLLKAEQQKELFMHMLYNKTIPVFLTSTNLTKTFNKSVPKYCYNILFEDSFISNMVTLYNKYYNKVPIKQNSIEIVAKKCNGDIRHFIKTISFLGQGPLDEKEQLGCEKEQLDEKEPLGGEEERPEEQNIKGPSSSNYHSKNISIKDIEYDVRSSLKNIYNKSINLDDKIILGSIHTNSVVQENYISFFQKFDKLLNKKQVKLSFSTKEEIKDPKKDGMRDLLELDKQLNTLSEIADSIAIGDIFSEYILKNQLWDSAELVDECAINGTIRPLLTITNNQKIYDKDLNNVLENISYAPNYRNSGTSSFIIDEQISYALKYIFNIDSDKESLKIYYKDLIIDETRLRNICKMEDLNFNRYKYLLNCVLDTRNQDS